MVMTSIEVKIPETAKKYVISGTTEKIRSALLIYPSIVRGDISYGRAAELLEMHKMELIELYGSMGIPYFDMTDEEFEEELKTIERWKRKQV